MKPLKQKVSITLDEDVVERAKLLAEACDRSFSQYVNLMLRQLLPPQEQAETELHNNKDSF